jgi:serine/threonine protein kinase
MIGQGSFATVHKAKELSTGRDVALKMVRPEKDLNLGDPTVASAGIEYKDVLRAMKLEVQYVEALGSHPNIVKILGTAEGYKIFVMERAVTDLCALIKDQPLLPLQTVKHWTKHVLSAVRYMHDVGVVHMDIKSSNILIFADRTAKMCDFGLARKSRSSMPVDRELVTLWYRAPELIMGDSVYSPKVDEWGVGCVVLEMLIGTAPFKGKPECVCSCDSVLHHNYNSDQLVKIFTVLGTPQDPALLSRMTCAAHFAKWPPFPRKLDAMVRNSACAVPWRKLCAWVGTLEYFAKFLYGTLEYFVKFL